MGDGSDAEWRVIVELVVSREVAASSQGAACEADRMNERICEPVFGRVTETMADGRRTCETLVYTCRGQTVNERTGKTR